MARSIQKTFDKQNSYEYRFSLYELTFLFSLAEDTVRWTETRVIIL